MWNYHSCKNFNNNIPPSVPQEKEPTSPSSLINAIIYFPISSSSFIAGISFKEKLEVIVAKGVIFQTSEL